MPMKPAFRVLLALGLQCAPAFVAGAAAAQQLIHNPKQAAIASAVEVPAGKTVIYLSGKLPKMLPGMADAANPASYGDTGQQSASVFAQIEEELAGLGLSSANVVKMTVFLVADPASGKLDFAGLMDAYRRFYGTAAQPNVPARSTVQVAALVNPAALVEIEVVAMRP